MGLIEVYLWAVVPVIVIGFALIFSGRINNTQKVA